VPQDGELVLQLRCRQLESLHQLRLRSLAFILDVLVNLLLQIRQAIGSFQPAAFPEDLLGSLTPRVTDPDPVANINIAVLAKRLSFRSEDLILCKLFAAVLAFDPFRHFRFAPIDELFILLGASN